MITCYCIDLLLSVNPVHMDGGQGHTHGPSIRAWPHPALPCTLSLTVNISFPQSITQWPWASHSPCACHANAHHRTSARLSHCSQCPSYCSLFQAHRKWHSSLGSIPYLQDRVSYPFPVFPDSVGSTSLIALVTEYFDIFIALSVSRQTNFLHLPPTKSTICFTVGIQKKRMS